MVTITTRPKRISRAMAKYEVDPSMSTFSIFFDSSTVASLRLLPWKVGSSGAMAPCRPSTVPVPMALDA